MIIDFHREPLLSSSARPFQDCPAVLRANKRPLA